MASEAREADGDTADGEDFREDEDEDEDEVDDYGLADPLVEVDDLCNQNRPVGVRFDSCHCRTVGIRHLVALVTFACQAVDGSASKVKKDLLKSKTTL